MSLVASKTNKLNAKVGRTISKAAYSKAANVKLNMLAEIKKALDH